jgi:cholesterol oxidase
MLADQSVSLADGLPVVAITYASDAPIPWRWVRDEVRWLSDDTFAAMSYVDLPGIRRLGGLPFLLKRQRSPAARSAHRG